jgi:hypothetical protein
LKNRGFEPEPRGEDLIFNFRSGKTEVNAEVAFTFESIEQKMVIVEIDTNLKASCRYNEFKDHLLDLMTAAEKVELCWREVIKDTSFGKKSLTCELKKTYKLTGVLSELGLSSFTAKMGNRYSIDFFGNKVVVYGDVDSNIVSVLQKIITMYL